MDMGIIAAAIMGIGALVMLIGAIRAIYAGTPDRSMRENIEYTQVRQKGYKVRKRQLWTRFSVSFSLVIGLIITSAWSISALVHDMMYAPYNFARGQAEVSWWPPVVSFFAVGGAVIALVVWVGTLRRLRALKAVRSYAE